MKQEHLDELTAKLPEITKKFNEVLSAHGLSHIVVQSANFSYAPCVNGQCPAGSVATPFYNPVTQQFDLCLCVPV